MMVPMARVQLAGPAVELDRTLAVLQDVGALHVVPAAVSAHGHPMAAPERDARRLRRVLDDVDRALSLLGAPTPPVPPLISEPRLPVLARFARRARREAERRALEAAALEDERVLLLRYREFFSAFEPLLGRELSWPDGRAFYVVLRAGAADAAKKLESSLVAAVGPEFELLTHPLASGETAVLLLVSNALAAKVGQLLSESRVQELPAPKGLTETNLLRAMPALKARLAAIPVELATLDKERHRQHLEQAVALEQHRGWLHDRLLLREARACVHQGQHLFIVEGWLPGAEVAALSARVTRELGPEIVVQQVASETWGSPDAPVTLKNPPLFRPFEVVTRMLPLPRYGTIDPTPFVAVFFPMFFGLMVGDVGYGLLAAGFAVALRLRSKPGTKLRSIAAVAGACAAFAIIFGFVFGELFGSLGQRLGLHPLGFDREKAIIPFLALTIALGVVHVVLGLGLAVAGAWRRGHKREAMGRSVAAAMVLLTVTCLLAAFRLLPQALFTPMVIALLVAFPVLIALEGIVAIVELLSSFGHILSYARIMALGTASLMLAVVANQMVGAMGSVVVGVVFALLFHTVNFAIALFSPTIHALRLHYVEFFGKFYSPGGTAYRPLTHWHPGVQGG